MGQYIRWIGQLTITPHFKDEDYQDYYRLIDNLQTETGWVLTPYNPRFPNDTNMNREDRTLYPDADKIVHIQAVNGLQILIRDFFVNKNYVLNGELDFDEESASFNLFFMID